MERSIGCCLAVFLIVTAGSLAHASGTFDNPNYTYTQVWNADAAGQTDGRWPDYSAAAGKILWRDNGGNAYLADFDTSTGAITNQTTIATAAAYEASFAPSGNYVFYQDTSASGITHSGANGGIDAYTCVRYNVTTGVKETVFDISNVPVGNVEALTPYTGSQFGFYASQGGSDNEILMSVRKDAGQMEVVRYDITAKTFTNLTNSTQADYDGQYFGADTSKLLYWTESYPEITGEPAHARRGISILDGSGETVLDSVLLPDGYLSARWGQDHEHVMATLGDKSAWWGSSDLVMLSLEGGSWVSEDLTGPGWTNTDGGIYPGAWVQDGFLFGVVNSDTTNNGIWYAQEIAAVPVPGAVLLGTLGFGTLGWLRRRRAL